MIILYIDRGRYHKQTLPMDVATEPGSALAFHWASMYVLLPQIGHGNLRIRYGPLGSDVHRLHVASKSRGY